MTAERDHSEFAEMCALYSLGVLDDDDLRTFDAHLRGCALCQAEVRRTDADVARLAKATSYSAPPFRLRAKVVGRIEAISAGPRRERVPTRAWWPRLAVGFGMAALLLAFAGWWKALDLSRQILALERQMRQMEIQVSEQTAQLALFRSPASESIYLAGQESALGAKGKMVWDPGTGAGLFLAASLPPLPPDRIYQLWVIADGKPVSAGVFSVDKKGSGELTVSQLPQLDSIQAFAVTLEPAGGLPQPSGQMYLVGSFPKS